jgi:hypothetical protein
MRAHLGLIAFAVVLVLGVILEFVGSNLLGTLLILGAVAVGIGGARQRSVGWNRPGLLPSDKARADVQGTDYEDMAGGSELARRDRERY